MDTPMKSYAHSFLTASALAVSIVVTQSCAPRQPYRPPSVSRAPMIAPAPKSPPPPAPVRETTRKPLPEESKIQEQDLSTNETRNSLVLEEGPLAPAGATSPGQPALQPALPDDSSLLAKITPGTSPRRNASLRLTEEGRKLLDAGDVARALNRLEQSITIDSTNGYGYFYLAMAHYKLRRYKESLNFLDVAESRLEGEPFWLAEVHALRGENYRALGMAVRADASFSKALSINPGNRTASEAISRVQNEVAAPSR
jgi:tetratricopeptide (TPR) repeat protein